MLAWSWAALAADPALSSEGDQLPDAPPEVVAEASGPPWPEPSDDDEDDPAQVCTVRRRDLDTGKFVGPEIEADGEGARKRGRGRSLVHDLDERTVATRDGELTTTWLQEESGDYLVVAWQGRGIYRSYRFWDDAIVAFDLADSSGSFLASGAALRPAGPASGGSLGSEGVQLVYDILGCDERELLRGVTAALALSR